MKEEIEMSAEFARGFAEGRLSTQPKWISVKERMPEKDGVYYTITELQRDVPFAGKGTISIDVTVDLIDGAWWQSDDTWKVIYWAEPIRLDVPAEFADRPRLCAI